MQEEKKENLDGVMSDDELDAVGGGIGCANRAVCNCINGLGENSDIRVDCACADGLGGISNVVPQNDCSCDNGLGLGRLSTRDDNVDAW